MFPLSPIGNLELFSPDCKKQCDWSTWVWQTEGSPFASPSHSIWLVRFDFNMINIFVNITATCPFLVLLSFSVTVTFDMLCWLADEPRGQQLLSGWKHKILHQLNYRQTLLQINCCLYKHVFSVEICTHPFKEQTRAVQQVFLPHRPEPIKKIMTAAATTLISRKPRCRVLTADKAANSRVWHLKLYLKAHALQTRPRQLSVATLVRWTDI